MNPRFTKGQPIRASDLNALADAACMNIIGGPGCAITRLGKKIVVNKRLGQSIRRGSRGACVWKMRASDGEIQWRYLLRDEPYNVEALHIARTDDGAIYVTIRSSRTAYWLVKLSASGREQWRFPIASSFNSIATDGTTIYVSHLARGSIGGGDYPSYANVSVFAIESDATVSWTYDTGASTIRAVDVSAYDNAGSPMIWIGVADVGGFPIGEELILLDDTGSNVWTLALPDDASPNIGNNEGNTNCIVRTYDGFAIVGSGGSITGGITFTTGLQAPAPFIKIGDEYIAANDSANTLRKWNCSGSCSMASSSYDWNLTTVFDQFYKTSFCVDPSVVAPSTRQFYMGITGGTGVSGAGGDFANLLLLDTDGTLLEWFDLDASTQIYGVHTDGTSVWACGDGVSP